MPNILSSHVTMLTVLAQKRALAKEVQQAGQSNLAVLGRAQRLTRPEETAKESGSRQGERVTFSWKTGSAFNEGNSATEALRSTHLGAWSPANATSSAGPLETNGNFASSQDYESETPRTSPESATSEKEQGEPAQGRMTAEQQAAMMAENQKTAENIRKIYDEMWAEIRKSQAQRFQIVMETMNSISDTFRKLHESQVQSSDTHHRAILAAIIDAPTK